VAKINIYVPDDLHEQMRADKDGNWSRIAQDAFRRFLNLQSLDDARAEEVAKRHAESLW